MLSLFIEPAIGLPLFALLGLVMGSFGNVVIGRVPSRETLGGRSHCVHCKKTLSPAELIPVLSWVFLRGKCFGCKKPISMQYPIIELLMGVLFVIAAVHTSFQLLPAVLLCIVFWAMLLITVIDLQTQMIPDALTIVLALSGFFYHWASMGIIAFDAMVLGVAFLGVQWLMSRGRWIGTGDLFLIGALGLLLGAWQLMAVGLFVGYIVGAVIAGMLLLTKKISRNAHVPFGPFLITGAFVALVWGEEILRLAFP